MKITQGTFSFLPELTDEEIRAQVEYAIENEWAIAIEFTDDPHPRNTLWEMWDLPMFDIKDGDAAVYEINKCREAYPNHYVKVVAYDSSPHRATTAFDFIVNRPPEEPGFRLDRQEANDRHIHYTLHSYAVEQPHGERYGNGKARDGKADGKK
jgi:ribulose-bisphosphate carboxylase small chain